MKFRVELDQMYPKLVVNKFISFGVVNGNTKVRMPIINLGSGMECPNRESCPFSIDNFKATGYPLCYAQKMERLRPNVLESKNRNQRFIQWWREQSLEDKMELLHGIADIISYLNPFAPFIRLNEAHDLSDENIGFAIGLQAALKLKKLHYSASFPRLYGYTKSDENLRVMLNEAGARIIRSEVDFIAVNSVEEAKEKGLEVCPGVCGPCVRCPMMLKTAIVRH